MGAARAFDGVALEIVGRFVVYLMYMFGQCRRIFWFVRKSRGNFSDEIMNGILGFLSVKFGRRKLIRVDGIFSFVIFVKSLSKVFEESRTN